MENNNRFTGLTARMCSRRHSRLGISTEIEIHLGMDNSQLGFLIDLFYQNREKCQGVRRFSSFSEVIYSIEYPIPAELFVSLETPLNRKHNPLTNTKKTPLIEHFKAALRTPAVDINQTGVGSDQQTVGADEKMLCTDQQMVGADEKMLCTDQQTVGADEKMLCTDQQTVGADEKMLCTDQQTVGADEKMLCTDQQTVGADEKMLCTDQQIVGAEEQTPCTEQKIGSIDQEEGNNSLSVKNVFADKIKI